MDEVTLSILLLIFVVLTVLFMIMWIGCKTDIKKLDKIVVNDYYNDYDGARNIVPYVRETVNELTSINADPRLL